MQIGIKLDLDYQRCESYRELYGSQDVLPFLRELGLAGVEVPIGAETNSDELLELVKRCRNADLSVSLHPYTERSPNNPAHFASDDANACRSLHERFLGLACRAAELQGDPVIANIHPAAGRRAVSRRELIEQSIRFFDWARRWCSQNAPDVQPVAELQIRANPDEDIQRIGDAYDELFEIVERSKVGATWDFGHAFMNAWRFGDDVYPPGELLQHVAHVHCHDVSDSDHQPLVFGRVPWQRFLSDLVAAGFDGKVILEVRPEEFLAAGGLDALTNSVRELLEFAE